MILYRVQSLGSGFQLDIIQEAKDMESFFSYYPTRTFKVTTLMDEEEFVDRFYRINGKRTIIGDPI